MEFGLCKTISIDHVVRFMCLGDGGNFFQVDLISVVARQA
jgi:hypothetical protein